MEEGDVIMIIQLLLLIFDLWVYLPLFGSYGLGEALKMVILSPIAIGALVFNLLITIIKLFKALTFRRKFGIYFNLIILLINIILRVVFIF